MKAPRKGLIAAVCLALLLWAAGCASPPQDSAADTMKSDVAAILQKADRPNPAVLAQLDAQLRWIFERRVQREKETPQD